MALPTQHDLDRRGILKNLDFPSVRGSSLDSRSQHVLNLAPFLHRVIVAQMCAYVECVRRIYEKKKRAFTVSLIGCGQIGKKFLRALLRMRRIDPDHIIVSTRQPELLETFPIRVCRDNAYAAKRGCVVCILCTYPQLRLVAASVRGQVRANAILVSAVASAPVAKIRQLFDTSSAQTIRTHVSSLIVSQRLAHDSIARSDIKRDDPHRVQSIATSQIFRSAGDGVSGILSLHRAITNLASKFGMPDPDNVAFETLFGDGSTVGTKSKLNDSIPWWGSSEAPLEFMSALYRTGSPRAI